MAALNLYDGDEGAQSRTFSKATVRLKDSKFILHERDIVTTSVCSMPQKPGLRQGP